jgi:putative ABC transport system permease protein
MDLMEQARVAVDSILANKLRSFLTTLGVIIGVTSVILLVSIGEGMRNYLADMFAGMGSNLLFVFPGKRDTHGGGHSASAKTVHKLTVEDLQAIRQRSLNVIGAAPMVVGGGKAERADRYRDTMVLGTDQDFPIVHTQTLSAGEFLREEDVNAKRRVVVIGKTIATELFGDRSPLGQPIKVSDARFLVIGVMAPKGQSLGIDFDDVVYIPVTVALDLFNEEGLTRISVKTANPTNLDPAIDDIQRLLKHRHNNREDFTIVSQADLLDTFNQIASTMTYVLLGIASISLLVGGIGIMNIMLVSVRERTREIGVRKALGARKRDILAQFLIESIMVSLLGGAVGLGLGSLVAVTISAAVPEIPTKITLWIIMVAFGFSVGVGVFFGVTPARTAANLDPIEALRYE